MKSLYLLLACAAIAAFMPVHAQGRRTRATKPSAAANAVPAAPKTGVRFVVCSPTGENMPSPLYVRNGKEFTAIQIGARTASPRVKPVNGKVDFWLENPMPTAGMQDEKKKGPGATPKLPEPFFTVKVPGHIEGKAVCILSPNKDISKTTSLFLKESDFPRKGIHIINLSSFQMEVITSQKGDFSDKERSEIGVYRREDGICNRNSWSFKGEKGQQIGFMLSYFEKGAKTPKRLKASTVTISDRQTSINIIVKDAKLNRPRLIAIQLSNDKN